MGSTCIALMLSVFLIYFGRSSALRLPGCGEGTDCHSVVASPWAFVGSIPVAWVGVIGFSILLISLLFTIRCPSEQGRNHCWVIALLAAKIGMGFTVWLLVLQSWEIGHFCIFCVSVHLAGIIAYIGVFRLSQKNHVPRSLRMPMMLSASVALGIMITAHVMLHPSDLVVIGQEDHAHALPEWEYIPDVPITSVKQSRLVTLMNGQMTFDLKDVPTLGTPDATCVIAEIFDPTCMACRKVYRQLIKYQRLNPGKLAVAQFIVPLHPDCNPTITVAPPESTFSCEYARLCLAVYFADAVVYPTFQHFLMQGEQIPSVKEAKSKAAEWVGADKLVKLMTAPEVDQQLHDALQLYRHVGGKSVPRIILPDQVVATAGGAETKLFALFDQVCVTATNR